MGGGDMGVSYPAATWRPGPRSKQGYDGANLNAARGLICHSMVGSMAGAMARLDDLTDNASWHFSICKDGRVYQHYDVTAVTWHAGSRVQNVRLIGIEHEGGADTPETVSEPLTPAQRMASVQLVRWLAARFNIPLIRGAGLFEHREVYATACPSGRIPWEYYKELPQVDPKDLKIALLELRAKWMESLALLGISGDIEKTEAFLATWKSLGQ